MGHPRRRDLPAEIQDAEFDQADGRRLRYGLNFAPTVGNRCPLGAVPQVLYKQMVESRDPVCMVLHAVAPHFRFADKGKSMLTTGGERMSINSKLDAMADRLIMKVTKDFTTAKKRTKRGRGLSNTALRRLYSRNVHKTTIKDACYLVMAEAYQVASGNGKFAANARQIMYQARPRVLKIIDKFCKNDSDFTQKHLPNFMAENPSLTASWDVTFDARGAITEPHTKERIGLGTVEVREYAEKWHTNLPSLTLDPLELGVNTSGPDNRFEYMLLIEKEGFDDQLEQARSRSVTI